MNDVGSKCSILVYSDYKDYELERVEERLLVLGLVGEFVDVVDDGKDGFELLLGKEAF